MACSEIKPRLSIDDRHRVKNKKVTEGHDARTVQYANEQLTLCKTHTNHLQTPLRHHNIQGMYKPKCLNPECDGLFYARGLCITCYECARRYVSDGKITWSQLEKQGKALPKGSQRRTVAKWLLSVKIAESGRINALSPPYTAAEPSPTSDAKDPRPE